MNVNLVAPPTAVAGEVTSTTITIENSSAVVRELRLTLLGIAGWADLDQPVLKLFPGELGVASIRFHPPATPQVAAGDHPFAVRCVATDDQDEPHIEESIVRVAPHTDVDIRLTPSCARARRSTTFQLTVTNEGNQRERFQLGVDDANDMLELDLAAASVDLAAGRTAFIRLRARNTTGQPGEHLPFQVHVSSPTLGSRVATGSLTIRRSRLRPALMVAAAIVCILLFAANVWSSEPTSHAVDASLPATTVVRPSTSVTPADTTPDTSLVATTLPQPPPSTSTPETTSTTLPAAVPLPPMIESATTIPAVPSHQPETPITTVPPAPTTPPTTQSIPIPTAPTVPATTQASATTAPPTTTPQPKPPDYATETFVIYFHVDPNGLFNPSSNCQMIHSPTESTAYTSSVSAGWTIDTTKGDPAHPGISDIVNGSNSQANGTLILYDYQARSANTFAVTGQVCGSSNAGPGAIFSHTYRVFLTRPAA